MVALPRVRPSCSDLVWCAANDQKWQECLIVVAVVVAVAIAATIAAAVTAANAAAVAIAAVAQSGSP